MKQIIQVLKQRYNRLKRYFPLSFSDTYTILVNSVKAGCYYFKSAYRSRVLVRETASFISRQPRIKMYYDNKRNKQLQLVESMTRHYREEYAKQIRDEIQAIIKKDQ